MRRWQMRHLTAMHGCASAPRSNNLVQVPIAIVGCGGMGGRHLRALGALQESGMSNVDLVAVCDTREENAIFMADNAEQMLGKRPKVFISMADMKKNLPDIEAVSITTDSGSHHLVAEMAFDLGTTFSPKNHSPSPYAVATGCLRRPGGAERC